MKLYPDPPTALTYFLSAVLGVVCVIAVERWFGQSLYNYFAFGVPLVLAWVLGKALQTPDSEPSVEQRLEAFFDAQLSAAQELPIRDIFGDNSLPAGCGAVRLADVYVPLDLAEVEPDKVHAPEFRRLSFAREAERSLPVVTALAQGIERAGRGGLRAVLVGEAGGGKSSVVGDLIQRCRHPESGPDRPGEPPEPWPEALRRRVVLRLDLRRLSGAAIDNDRSTAPFWQAVGAEIAERLDLRALDRDQAHRAVPAAVRALRAGLEKEGLLLLDGLDEVLDPTRRDQVRGLVERVAEELGAGCALLVTARPYVYPDHALTDFQVWQLQPLTVSDSADAPAQTAQLVRNWYRALGRDAPSAQRLIVALQVDPARAEMATRPLLLTLLIALNLERHGHRHAEPITEALPSDRADLLESATALFVQRWFERINRDAPGRLSAELLAALDRGRLREALQRVSLEAQEQRPRTDLAGGGDPQIEVWQSQFLGSLYQALPPALRSETDRIERLVLERAGLLFPRGRADGGARYGYVHRQFHEYLAACELVERDAHRLEDRLGTALRASPSAWREVARFAVVRLAREHGPH